MSKLDTIITNQKELGNRISKLEKVVSDNNNNDNDSDGIKVIKIDAHY
jgi:transcriptional regulator of heat shock response